MSYFYVDTLKQLSAGKGVYLSRNDLGLENEAIDETPQTQH